jgi:hypothetical protein
VFLTRRAATNEIIQAVRWEYVSMIRMVAHTHCVAIPETDRPGRIRVGHFAIPHGYSSGAIAVANNHEYSLI